MLLFADFSIDRHTIAAISLAGSICDVFGGLYLAYDLLGRNHGTITRSHASSYV